MRVCRYGPTNNAVYNHDPVRRLTRVGSHVTVLQWSRFRGIEKYPIVVAASGLIGLPLTLHTEEVAAAQNKSVKAVRVDTAPVIDGVLDDPVWEQATIIRDLHQARPYEYSEPNARSEFYVIYDKDAIYVGGHHREAEPHRIVANQLIQDSPMSGEDRTTVVLDPFNDKRSGYAFTLNFNNVRRDGLYITPTQFFGEWDGIWQGKASLAEGGWTTEIAIPFKSLSFHSENDTWGFNVWREVGRTGERIAWVSHNRGTNPSAAGELRGLYDMETGLGLDFAPSIVLRQTRDLETGTTDHIVEPSLNVFYKITPSMNGSLTINTDFSAVEADARQVNLTRFGLFFPEKRDFFLKEADIFEFGRIGGSDRLIEIPQVEMENGRPFFSRRIGLSEDNEPVDLDYGAKVSGRMGQWNIGGLAVRQTAVEDVDAADLFVGRITRNILNESAVGFIVTRGEPTSNSDNTLFGIDFNYLNTSLSGGRIVEASAWYQRSDTDGLDGDDAAWGLRLRTPNTAGFRTGLTVNEIQEHFHPGLGFVNRSGVRDYIGELGYTFRPRGTPVREIFAGIDARHVDRLEGGTESSLVSFRFMDILTHNGDKLEAMYRVIEEGLTEPFEISSGVVIPPGFYSFDEYGIRISGSAHRRLSGGLNVFRSTDYDGDRLSIDGRLEWKPSRHFNIEAKYQYNDFELPFGHFTTRLITLQPAIVFSETLSLVTLMQYDNRSNTLGINSRVYWVPEAGRELFFVVNHNLSNSTDSLDSIRADMTLKVNYNFRF